jgi:BlaI family penicillinase repressor
MPNPKPNVTEAELAVLECMWNESPATIRSITDRLYPDGSTAQYATVQKLLERLEHKGYVRRERRSVPHRFRAKLDRDAFISLRLHDVADTLCGGSLTPLLTQLVERGSFSENDIQTLRKLVKQLERKQRGAS